MSGPFLARAMPRASLRRRARQDLSSHHRLAGSRPVRAPGCWLGTVPPRRAPPGSRAQVRRLALWIAPVFARTDLLARPRERPAPGARTQCGGGKHPSAERPGPRWPPQASWLLIGVGIAEAAPRRSPTIPGRVRRRHEVGVRRLQPCGTAATATEVEGAAHAQARGPGARLLLSSMWRGAARDQQVARLCHAPPARGCSNAGDGPPRWRECAAGRASCAASANSPTAANAQRVRSPWPRVAAASTDARQSVMRDAAAHAAVETAACRTATGVRGKRLGGGRLAECATASARARRWGNGMPAASTS
jgi:hypothetical protein